MAFVKYLRENAVHELYGSVEQNVARYQQDEPWLAEAAGGKPWELESRIELPDHFVLAMPDGDNLRDLENTLKLYAALRGLSPAQATDERLWTYLTHATFWPYMRQRWRLEASAAKDRNPKGYILERYFVRSRESRALLRNGLARLWWYGFLTYDDERDNPYELTGVLLGQLDTAQQILERSLGRNRDILHAFLAFLLAHPELAKGDKARETVRALAKRLNLHGGLCVLDSLDRSDIRQWLEETFTASQTAAV
jgi:hypothetical protein